MVTKRDKIIGMACVGLLFVSCIYVLSGSEDTDSMSYHRSPGWTWNNYDQVLEEARSSQKYVLIDFWAVWCKECKEMEKNGFADPEVADLLNQFVLLKVDVDDIPELKARFSVVGMPTIVVVTAHGEEVGRVVGYQDAQQLKAFLGGILA
jgi:thiol:disulfide interchange protein DsbD